MKYTKQARHGECWVVKMLKLGPCCCLHNLSCSAQLRSSISATSIHANVSSCMSQHIGGTSRRGTSNLEHPLACFSRGSPSCPSWMQIVLLDSLVMQYDWLLIILNAPMNFAIR
jgi:hypothetical protein